MSKTFENQNRLYTALKAARIGRDILLDHFGRLKTVEKKHLAGWVSEADKKSEQAIFSFLGKEFPEDELLGEESASEEFAEKPSQKGRWILDPLDGTTNYIHSFSAFAVSLAYEWKGQIQIGVIDLPALGLVYSCVRGQGAFCNGRQLQVSKTEKISESLLATGFFGEVPEALQEQIELFSSLVTEARGIRRVGAAAYDLCLVAEGVFDAYWEKGLSAWDSAAGCLLVEEAGGVVKNYQGQDYSPYDETILAGNPIVVPQILERFASLKKSRQRTD